MERYLRQGDPFSIYFSYSGRSITGYDNGNFFHDVSGLKINLAKSPIFGIGIPMADVANITTAINCSYGSLPFNYLGLSLGKSINRVDAWNGVVGNLLKRLAAWKINLLSVGGRSIRSENVSLLGKWRWCYLNETGVLWRKVISKMHGSDGGFEAVSGSGQKAGVWKNIIGCCSKLNQMGISFSNIMVKKVSSDGLSLMALAMNLAWRRQPSGRAVDELSLLSYFINGLFSTFLVKIMVMWNSWVPQKINICAWRVDLNRLLTNSNLMQHGVYLPSSMCSFCCSDEELGITVFSYSPLSRSFGLKSGFGGVFPPLLTPLSRTLFLEISASLKINGPHVNAALTGDVIPLTLR
ncbi:hypothetical protein CTI12_AA229920 [Artemisia annua]|uniref:Reverse transcriptase zinc-binding domain-containing protein n=1 Tax=Artemisia annua TaxID=35608 RepID=A0A2U1NTB1_ARTAN|nr:hypothetical protein CTI12_AA229920 [Artemisia annua]